MSHPIERQHTGARMSKIVTHAGVVYLCGQTASGSDAAGVQAQTQEVLKRIDALLAEAGSGKGCILSALIHLKTMEDFAAMNQVWEAWVPAGAAPARTTVEARMASDSVKVEITIVAAAA